MSKREPVRAAAALRPNETPDDEELVRAAQQGDRLAFEALFRRHVDAVYARLTRLIGYSEEREDLVQQVFFRFHRSLPRFRGESSVATYLHGIVVHVAYEALRKRSRATRPLTDHELDRLVANDGTPEASARQREQLARIFRLLDRLKPKKRVAFVLHVVEGLPLTEVAALMRAEPRAVGQRVAYARRELLQMLQREERKGSVEVDDE